MLTCITLNMALSLTLCTRITWKTMNCTRYHWMTSLRLQTSWEWEWVRSRPKRSSMRWTWTMTGVSAIKSFASSLLKSRDSLHSTWTSGQRVPLHQSKKTWKLTLILLTIPTWWWIRITTQLSRTERAREKITTSLLNVADSNPSGVNTSAI